jgi:hypothetical protein
MARMEHLMNVYASKAAKGSIAEFLVSFLPRSSCSCCGSCARAVVLQLPHMLCMCSAVQ